MSYSLAIGIDPRLFGFWIRLAWFLSLNCITDGRRRQGSPSTCMGIDFFVINFTLLHCVILSPWPPICNAA